MKMDAKGWIDDICCYALKLATQVREPSCVVNLPSQIWNHKSLRALSSEPFLRSLRCVVLWALSKSFEALKWLQGNLPSLDGQKLLLPSQPSFHLIGFLGESQLLAVSELSGRFWCVSLVYLSLFSIFFISLTSSGGKSLVLLFDLIELLHVVEELVASLQSDEKLGLLAVTSWPLNSDGSCSNLLELGVVVSKKQRW